MRRTNFRRAYVHCRFSKPEGHLLCNQGCSGAGTRGNRVPTPFSYFALKFVWSCFKMASFLGAFPHLFRWHYIPVCNICSLLITFASNTELSAAVYLSSNRRTFYSGINLIFQLWGDQNKQFLPVETFRKLLVCQQSK